MYRIPKAALLPLLALAASAPAQLILYVDADAPGANDGSSWQNAYTDLQLALEHTWPITERPVEIRIAAGRYAPPSDPENATFRLGSGVSLYGGFAGFGSTDPHARDIRRYQTVLSGAHYPNAATVLFVKGGPLPVTLNGLTVTRGFSDFEGGGLFVQFGNVIVESCYFVENVAVRRRGLPGDDSTGGVANGGGSGAAVVVSSSDTAVFRSCRFESNRADGNGGAIVVYGSQSVSLEQCEFVDNHAGNVGGAVFIFASECHVVGCNFRNNSAGGGGALSINNTTFFPRSGFVSASRFSGNSAIEDAGAIRIHGAASFHVRDCHFAYNLAGDRGGAVMATSLLRVEDCEFIQNAAASGGGVYYRYADLSAIARTAFDNNSGIAGGAVANSDGALLLDQCLFLRNNASVGGAIWHESGATGLVSSLLLSNVAAVGGAIGHNLGTFAIANSTVVANHAVSLGGGVATGQGMSILNSLVWSNTEGSQTDPFQDELAQIAGGRAAAIDYSAVQGWTGQFGGSGNTGNDPMFVHPLGSDEDPGTAHYNYRLRSNSPLVNAGDPDYALDPANADLDGHARVLCGRVDMGAYEFGIGDFNCDRVTELADFAAWPACMTGPAGEGDLEAPLFPESCEAFEFSPDGAIDLQDYAGYQRITLAP